MLPLTKQERVVLVYLGFIFLFGLSLHHAFKINPRIGDLVNLMDSDKVYPKIDVNRAGYDDLVAIPYIGPATAQRILDYRDAHGPFQSLAQLRSIPSVYPHQYNVFSKFLKVERNK